jgi:hypothetical protein
LYKEISFLPLAQAFLFLFHSDSSIGVPSGLSKDGRFNVAIAIVKLHPEGDAWLPFYFLLNSKRKITFA